jgi:hypothetical protein
MRELLCLRGDGVKPLRCRSEGQTPINHGEVDNDCTVKILNVALTPLSSATGNRL